MSYEETGVWSYLVAAVVTYAVYVALLVRRADGGPLVDTPYVSLLLWMLLVSVVISVVARVVLVAARPGEGQEVDVRDRQIARHGDTVGGQVLSIAVVGVLVLAVLEVDHFWIANAVYLAFVLQAVVSSAAKLVAYRRGF